MGNVAIGTDAATATALNTFVSGQTVSYEVDSVNRSDDASVIGIQSGALETKYMFVCHAELNAILNYSSANGTLKGSKVYTTLFPCNECAKALVQSGVGEIVYYSDKYSTTDSTLAAKRMFRSAGIKLTPYEFSGKKEIIEL